MPEEHRIPLEGERAAETGRPEPREKKPQRAEEEPISLVEEGEVSSAADMRAFGAVAAAAEKKIKFKRPLNVTGEGATRCRVFHSKIAPAPLSNMVQAINEWLDSDKIEVKHVGHIIGVMEGKRPEPNLIVIVWF